MAVRLQEEPFDFGALCGAFAESAGSAGAVVTFAGRMRSEDGQLAAMTIEHYPGMTEKALAKIEAEARSRWGLTEALILHRHGRILPGEAIMMVATAARHRSEAFAAAEFLMDYLKSRAPFWKKEEPIAGAAAWVEARESDEAALARWDKET